MQPPPKLFKILKKSLKMFIFYTYFTYCPPKILKIIFNFSKLHTFLTYCPFKKNFLGIQYIFMNCQQTRRKHLSKSALRLIGKITGQHPHICTEKFCTRSELQVQSSSTEIIFNQFTSMFPSHLVYTIINVGSISECVTT